MGLALQRNEIVVRLHSTDGMLMRYEPRVMSARLAGRYELERKALLDADRVVAHLPSIAEENRSLYGFDAQWMKKVSVEFPPAASATHSRRASRSSQQRDLVFLTKLQPIKRPDVFIRAACLLLRTRPDYLGQAILACHASNREYAEKLQRLVPPDLAPRVLFTSDGERRTRLLRDADDRIDPEFIARAVAALEARREFDVVVPTTGYFTSGVELEAGKFSDYACFLGDAPSLGLVAWGWCPAASPARPRC